MTDQKIAENLKAKQTEQKPRPNHKHPNTALLDDSARTLAETLHEGVWLSDPEDRIVFVNRRLADMLGYEPKEMIGRPLLPFFHERCTKTLQRNLLRRHLGIAEEHDYMLVRKDGTKFIARVAAQPISDGAGAHLGTLVAVIDVTDLRKAGQALAASERRYRNLFEHSPVALLEIDVSEAEAYIKGLTDHGVHDVRTYFDKHPEALVKSAALVNVLEVNESALKLLSFERKQDLLQQWVKIILAEDRELIQDSVEAFADGATVFERETEARTPAGEVKHLIFSTSREPVSARVVVAVTDVSERRRLEEQLLHAERAAAVGEAALMIGHDLRNPLQAITNELYLATHAVSALPKHDVHDAGRSEMLDACDRIRKQLSYANMTVADLQDSARDLQPHHVKIDVAKLISDTLATIFVPGNVVVEASISESPPSVCGDRGMLQRLLTNLTINALQAMPTGGRLTVTARASDGTLELSVQDTGPGIDGEPETVFEPFHTTRARGIGLGLAVCKRFAEAHGGRIEAANAAGSGARFTVWLPIIGEHVREEECTWHDRRS